MRLTDPFSGYKMIRGPPLLHFAQFLNLVFLPSEEPCNVKGYANIKTILLFAHALIVLSSLLALVL